MNPFRPNAAEEFTEDDLLAFHLHELSPSREQALRRAIETDPALATECEAVATSLDALKDVPMHVDRTILDRNWKALRPSLLPHARPVARGLRWRLPVFAGAAVAFAATAVFFVGPRYSSPFAGRKAAPSLGRATLSLSPAPSQNVAAGSNDGLPSEPLFKGNPHTSLFHPRADRPKPPIDPLTLAQVPAPLPPKPRVIPELPITSAHEPVATTAASSSIGEPVQPSGEIQAQPSGLGQEQVHGSKKRKLSGVAKAKREHTLDVMLGIGGNFVVPRSGQTATHAIAAVGAVHQQLRPALGYRITASYSRPEFDYNYPGLSGSYGTVHVNSRIYELAGTYVVQGPHHGRFRTSVDAGAGLLAFLPSSSYESPSSVFRIAGVAAINMDVAVTEHWGARMSYRAQVFRGPNFVYTEAGAPVTSAVTVSNDPSLGITYRFGKR